MSELPNLEVRPYGTILLDIDTKALSKEEFKALFEEFSKSAWRLELLAAYAVPNENAEFKAFLEGAPLAPVSKEALSGDGPWCQLIRRHVSAGRTMGRVHVLPELLTPYLRYEIEWGYTFNNAAGDNIQFIPKKHLNHALLSIISELQDFWIFDDTKVVLCDYAPNGSFQGGREIIDSSKTSTFIQAREALVSAALDFRTFMSGYRTGLYR